MSFPNNYTHRKVAETASKPCDICYKPTASCLVAPENKDFFYVCPAHLKEKGFCTPVIDEAAVAAKKKRELELEVSRVKQEFEEKQRRRKEKEEEKVKAKGKDQEKVEDKKGKDEIKDTKPSDEKKLDNPPEEEPRVFTLQKAFYQQRIDKKRNTEIAKRNRERLQNPNLFPQVPKGFP